MKITQSLYSNNSELFEITQQDNFVIKTGRLSQSQKKDNSLVSTTKEIAIITQVQNTKSSFLADSLPTIQWLQIKKYNSQDKIMSVGSVTNSICAIQSYNDERVSKFSEMHNWYRLGLCLADCTTLQRENPSTRRHKKEN